MTDAAPRIEALPLARFLARDYMDFLAGGSTLRAILRKRDVARDLSFELGPDIAARLSSGFELRPPLLRRGAREAQAHPYAEEWAGVAATIYRFGGRILYRELCQGLYEVKLELPPMHRNDQ